jgi:hypothetical protein
MGRLVLHVGAPKTGTKLIQKTLRANGSRLAENGVDVLLRDAYNSLAEGASVRWRRGRADVDVHVAVGDALRARLEEAPTVLVSHEDLLGPIASFRQGGRLYPDAAQVLRSLIARGRPDSVTITLSVRSPDRYVESVYLQLVRVGSTMRFDEYLRPIQPHQLSWLDLARRIEAAAGVVPIVRYFETIHAGARGYVRQFFDDLALGISPIFPFRIDQQNRGYSDVAMRIALAANAELSAADRRLLRRFLEENFSNRTHPGPKLLDSRTRQGWLDALSENHLALHERYVRSEASCPYLNAPGAGHSATVGRPGDDALAFDTSTPITSLSRRASS